MDIDLPFFEEKIPANQKDKGTYSKYCVFQEERRVVSGCYIVQRRPVEEKEYIITKPINKNFLISARAIGDFRTNCNMG